MESIADLRRDYTLMGLRRADLDPNPSEQFKKWFAQALKAGLQEVNAMTLSTVTLDGRATGRVVLLKGVDDRGFSFFTNYESRKGAELAKNPGAAMTFFWGGLERQVRVEGTVSKLPREEAEIYFKSRPPGSQLSAWVSKQSSIVPDRAALEAGLERVRAQYPNEQVPMPPYWGGYVLAPREFEFWQGRPNRLHDRFRYTLVGAGRWDIERLSP